MSRISEKFAELKKKRQKALITYITAGDPSLAVTEKLVFELERSGADIIELGVPFSDPLADGPVIQASHVRALKRDVSTEQVLALVKKVRAKSEVPIVLMISYNLIARYGIDKFFADSKIAGVDGVIPPDLSLEEAGELRKKAGGIDTIFLISPASDDERVSQISQAASGFIYLVSLTGVTGARKALPVDVKDNVARIRKFTDKPVAVGFGVSSPAQVKKISGLADGAIVGSAIVRLIDENKGKKAMLKKVGSFVKKLKSATVH
jgi:tryptophan synthase alpha chain